MAERDRLVEGYARAIFAVAEAERTLGDVEDELFRFGKAVEREPELRDALSDPALPADRKKAVVRELLGKKASTNTVNLLSFLIDQGRGRELPRIVEAMADVAAEGRRRVVAEVRSAVHLDERTRKKLATALSKATGKDVEVKALVDPSVVGGVVARVGDQVLDGTIRHRLQLARERLSAAR